MAMPCLCILSVRALSSCPTLALSHVPTHPQSSFPLEAELYANVISHKLPNYLGARRDVPHQINIWKWRRLEHLLEECQLVDFLQYGFPIGYCDNAPPTLNLKNHSSATANPIHNDKYISIETSKDAMLGPVSRQAFTQWTRVNPMMTRPKRDSDDLRVILDLSFPDNASVNSAIPKNSLEGSAFKMRLPSPRRPG